VFHNFGIYRWNYEQSFIETTILPKEQLTSLKSERKHRARFFTKKLVK